MNSLYWQKKVLLLKGRKMWRKMDKPNNSDSVTIESNKKILDTTNLGYNDKLKI